MVNSSDRNCVASVVYSIRLRARSSPASMMAAWSKARAPRSRLPHVDPRRIERIDPRRRFRRVGHHGQPGDAHHPHARVSVGPAECGQLFQVGGLHRHTGFLLQLQLCGIGEILLRPDKPSGQRPPFGERLFGPLQEKYLEAGVAAPSGLPGRPLRRTAGTPSDRTGRQERNPCRSSVSPPRNSSRVGNLSPVYPPTPHLDRVSRAASG